MAISVVIVGPDGKSVKSGTIRWTEPVSIPEGMKLSVRECFRYLPISTPTFTMDYRDATGMACWDFLGNRNTGFVITVIGPNVSEVIRLKRIMEVKAGIKNESSSLPGLPQIEGVLERISWLLRWIFKNQQ